jgi:hypothetical protein
MIKEKLNLDNIAHMWFWENDHRKSNKIFVAPKVGNDVFIGGTLNEGYGCYTIDKTPEITKLMRKKGVRFYTCDDDYEEGDDYRYGYFYPAKEINSDPVDQMEGDGHSHTFYKEEGKYKQL